ncbi:MAG TPA: hypothetical protein PKH79_12090 [Prolixibacteraceae bacterium]|nr:hypothetical protein [Prolixibacteraceae bacterium]
MKNVIKIYAVLIFVAMGIFSSCTPEATDPTAPTITVTQPTADTTAVFIGESVDFQVSLTSENGLKSFKAMSSAAGVEITNGEKTFSGSSSESVTVNVKVTSEVAAGTAIEITFVVEDSELSANTKKVVVAKAKLTPLSAATDFTWERIGGTAAVGLTDFGLSWTSNGADGKFAIIKKDADKFVLLDAAQWTTITNLEALKAAIDAATNMDSWKGVSAEASNTYDFTLGSIKGGTYYLIHITKGVVNVETAGAHITITGQFKK